VNPHVLKEFDLEVRSLLKSRLIPDFWDANGKSACYGIMKFLIFGPEIGVEKDYFGTLLLGGPSFLLTFVF
jgi:hypothetical protein